MVTEYLKVMEMFEELPKVEAPFSLSPCAQGTCWFRSREGYPGSDFVEQDLSGEGAYSSVKDAAVSFLADDDSGFIGTVIDTDVPYDSPDYVGISCLFASDDLTSGICRYAMNTINDTILFLGSTRMEYHTRVIEFIAALAESESKEGIDFNDICDGGSVCRPWKYQLFREKTMDAIRLNLAKGIASNASASELWAVGMHRVDDELHMAIASLLPGRGSDPFLSGVFDSHKDVKDAWFQVCLFWRDNMTDSSVSNF